MLKTKLIAAAVVVLALGSGAASASAAPTALKLLNGTAKDLVVKPAAIDWTGDGSGFFTGRGTMARHGRIRWVKWDNHQAVGYGNAQIKNCVPNCAVSKLEPHAVRLTLWRPKVSGGHDVFTRLTYTFTGRPPASYGHSGTLKESYSGGYWHWS